MPLRSLYSLPPADDVARFVAESYELGAIIDCTFLKRGFNDVYAIDTESGERFVLRIGNRRSRVQPNLDYETAFLSHLDRCGVPVAAPMMARDGKLWRFVALAEGHRPAVLFHFLSGHIARRDSAVDARAQGRTLAEIHRAGRSYNGPTSRIRLDGDHLIQRPLTVLLALPTLEPPARVFFRDLGALLTEKLEALEGVLSTGHCHGDCHGFNARITGTDPFRQAAAFFDFDDGGPGWLAYDLAVYLWNAALGRDGLSLWPPFLDGYQSLLPLRSHDLDATLLFVPIRHIWLLGEYAGRVPEWGLDTLPAAWLERQVEFLRDWEKEYLTARLF